MLSVESIPPHARLRSRAAENLARDVEQARGFGDLRLHSTACQRLHAAPSRKRVA